MGECYLFDFKGSKWRFSLFLSLRPGVTDLTLMFG